MTLQWLKIKENISDNLGNWSGCGVHLSVVDRLNSVETNLSVDLRRQTQKCEGREEACWKYTYVITNNVDDDDNDEDDDDDDDKDYQQGRMSPVENAWSDHQEESSPDWL